MSNNKKKAVAAKVAALMAKTQDSANTTEAEAAAALKMARALMDKYELDQSDVDRANDPIDFEEITKYHAKRPSNWIAGILNLVGDIFECIPFINEGRVGYIGTEARRKVAAYTVDALIVKGKKARREYLKHCSYISQRNRQFMADSFSAGWTVGVREKAAYLVPNPTPNGKGLVPVKEAEIWLNQNFSDLTTTTGRGAKNVNPAAYSQGENAGRTVNLHKATNEGRRDSTKQIQ